MEQDVGIEAGPVYWFKKCVESISSSTKGRILWAQILLLLGALPVVAIVLALSPDTQGFWWVFTLLIASASISKVFAIISAISVFSTAFPYAIWVLSGICGFALYGEWQDGQWLWVEASFGLLIIIGAIPASALISSLCSHYCWAEPKATGLILSSAVGIAFVGSGLSLVQAISYGVFVSLYATYCALGRSEMLPSIAGSLMMAMVAYSPLGPAYETAIATWLSLFLGGVIFITASEIFKPPTVECGEIFSKE